MIEVLLSPYFVLLVLICAAVFYYRCVEARAKLCS